MKYLSLDQQKILFVLALLMLTLLYFRFYHTPALPPEETRNEWVIEVTGEVQRPGIYLFGNPPTLIEATDRAGGFREPVDFDPGTSSEILETGTLLKISKESPDKIKVKKERMAANQLLVFSIPLDLNRATVEDLCLIPGIGESLAQEIIAYRNRKRGFRSVGELKHVKGIGETKYQSLKTFFLVKP